jgi:hypothetical protein
MTRNIICPLSEIVKQLAALAARPDVRFIAPYDLPFGDDWNWRDNYPAEHARWVGDASHLDKITILLRHDVDALPHRTLAMMREERKLGLVSAAFIFVRKVNQEAFYAGAGVQTDWTYAITDEAWLPFLDDGFTIGYHQNALDQAAGDFALAEGIGLGDVMDLSKRGFNTDCFTAHGGLRFERPGLPPATNNMLPPPAAACRWLGNGHGIHVAKNFSDSLRGRKICGSLAEFVPTMQQGRRYMILLHPQYYPDDLGN